MKKKRIFIPAKDRSRKNRINNANTVKQNECRQCWYWESDSFSRNGGYCWKYGGMPKDKNETCKFEEER